MTEAQIKHMVDRFLSWHVPPDFSPDGGIHFTGVVSDKQQSPPMPTGTNLFDASQADAMVRHMIEGLPEEGTPDAVCGDDDEEIQ